MLLRCLEGCGQEVRKQVTLYLQEIPHPSRQPLLSLLQYQGIKMHQKDLPQIQNVTILITDQMETESQQVLSVQSQNHEEVKAVKRRRESISLDEEIPDVNRLLDSLNESCNLVKRFKESNVCIDDKNSKTIKDILEKMLNVWGSSEQK